MSVQYNRMFYSINIGYRIILNWHLSYDHIDRIHRCYLSSKFRKVTEYKVWDCIKFQSNLLRRIVITFYNNINNSCRENILKNYSSGMVHVVFCTLRSNGDSILLSLKLKTITRYVVIEPAIWQQIKNF